MEAGLRAGMKEERYAGLGFDPREISTPCFVVDLSLLHRNLKILGEVKKRTSCKILLAQKAFSMFSVYPLLRKVLDGTCASSPHEARLGREEFGGEVHVFAAAYSDADFRELLCLSDHIIFNSFSQWRRFRGNALGCCDGPALSPASCRPIEYGIRVNPRCSTGTVPMYDPCAPFSRLGVNRDQFEPGELKGISGLHFHTLCEQNAEPLARTLAAFEEQFGEFIPQMEWINFGGGHHITREDYDIDLLCSLITDFRRKYKVDVYLEPGEAVALNTGFLVARVLDVIENGMDIAILDASAAAHMPDVLEMPYRPDIIGSGDPGSTGPGRRTYRLAGLTCLAGDVIGDYTFADPLEPGDTVVFTDMAHYSMVKTNTFNGIKLPSIAVVDPEEISGSPDDGSRAENRGNVRLIKTFGYADFKGRLS